MGMFSLRLARVEPHGEATKTVAILLAVKPSKIVRFKNTGVWLFIRRVSGVYRSAFSYVFTWQLAARLNVKSPYKRGRTGTGKRQFRSLPDKDC